MPGHHREAGGQLFMIITYSTQRAQHQEWSDEQQVHVCAYIAWDNLFLCAYSGPLSTI